VKRVIVNSEALRRLLLDSAPFLGERVVLLPERDRHPRSRSRAAGRGSAPSSASRPTRRWWEQPAASPR